MPSREREKIEMNILSVSARVYLAPEQMETGISFYERLLKQSCRIHFVFAKAGIKVAAVGSLLLIAGPEAALEPLRAITMTIGVASLDECQNFLLNEGAVITDGPQPVPTGLNMHARHPDGTLVEYVQIIPDRVAAVNLIRRQEA
jgi:predicted enzyme related to lactoylglutathione lyase